MKRADDLPSAVAAKLAGKTKRKQGKRYGHVTHQPVYCYQGRVTRSTPRQRAAVTPNH